MQRRSYSLFAAFAAFLSATAQGCAPARSTSPVTAPSGDERSYSGPPTTAAITPGDLKTRLFVFADDSMRGRAAGTADNLRGTAYIEREVRRLGLEPAGDSGTYFQNVPLTTRAISTDSEVTIDGQRFALATGFLPRDNGAGMRAIEGATAVYGGSWEEPAKLIDPGAAAGKVVVITVPKGWAVPRNTLNAHFSTAAAIAIASLDRIQQANLTELLAEAPVRLRRDAAPSPATPAFMYVSDALAKSMFGGAAPAALAMGTAGRQVHGKLGYEARLLPARNVVAILRGSDPSHRGQYVALGAHNDHIRVAPKPVDHDSLRAFNAVVRPEGAESPEPAVITQAQRVQIRAILDSLRRLRPPRADSINNGADDDGTGSMGVLEIAESFVKAKVRPRRSLLFVWHTGEELGLLGSSYFTDHTTVPRDSIVTQLNIDMIGRGTATDMANIKNGRPVFGSPTYVEVIGSRRLSTQLGDLIEEVNRKQSTPLSFDYDLDANGEEHQYYCRSDHYMYARYGIPITFFFTGVHRDYHQVTDEPQYIDYPHYARIVNLVRDIAQRVADLDHRPLVDKPKPNPRGSCVQ
ncbi:MAG: M28 family peptidase [Gemmatimonadales bacterium]